MKFGLGTCENKRPMKETKGGPYILSWATIVGGVPERYRIYIRGELIYIYANDKSLLTKIDSDQSPVNKCVLINCINRKLYY